MFRVPVDHIPSENTYLAAGIKKLPTGRYLPYLYSTPTTKKFKEYIVQYLIDTVGSNKDIEDLKNKIEQCTYFETEVQYYILENYDRKDLENFGKIFSDSVVLFVNKHVTKKFDDSKFIKITTSKLKLDDSNANHLTDYIDFKLYRADNTDIIVNNINLRTL